MVDLSGKTQNESKLLNEFCDVFVCDLFLCLLGVV